jgi:hypothetical protein
VVEESAGAPTGSCARAMCDRVAVDLAGVEENQARRRRGLCAGIVSLGIGGRQPLWEGGTQGGGGLGARDDGLTRGA